MCSICFRRRWKGLGKRWVDRGSRTWKSCAAAFQGAGASESKESAGQAASSAASTYLSCRPAGGGGELTPFVLNANMKSCEELLYMIYQESWVPGKQRPVGERSRLLQV